MPRHTAAPADPLAALKKRARILERLTDDRGRIDHWPTRRAQQLIALEHIAAQLEVGPVWTERELTALLEPMHAFNDPARIRRELIELGVLERRRDGSEYWKRADAPPLDSEF